MNAKKMLTIEAYDQVADEARKLIVTADDAILSLRESVFLLSIFPKGEGDRQSEALFDATAIILNYLKLSRRKVEELVRIRAHLEYGQAQETDSED